MDSRLREHDEPLALARREALALPVTASEEYDLPASASRPPSSSFCGPFVFAPNSWQRMFELNALGQHLAIFQNVSEKTIQVNVTRRNNISLRNVAAIQSQFVNAEILLRDCWMTKKILSPKNRWNPAVGAQRLAASESRSTGIDHMEWRHRIPSIEIRSLVTPPTKLTKSPRPEMKSSAPAESISDTSSHECPDRD